MNRLATIHSIERYQERVDPIAFEDARMALEKYQEIISKAHAFGCSVVRLGNGCRLLLGEDGKIITVLPKGAKGHRVQRKSLAPRRKVAQGSPRISRTRPNGDAA